MHQSTWQVKKLPIKPNYKRPSIVAGDLNTPVTFFEFEPGNGPDPSETPKKQLYKCTALMYHPSMKDRAILNGTGTNEAITIKIRDPYKDYIPTNKHKVVIDDYRILPLGKEWEIFDVAPDFEDNRFVKIVLGYTS